MKQRFVVMRDTRDDDFVNGFKEKEFETLDEANRECIKRTKMENDRWKLAKKLQPDLPRNALSYFRVEKR